MSKKGPARPTQLPSCRHLTFVLSISAFADPGWERSMVMMRDWMFVRLAATFSSLACVRATRTTSCVFRSSISLANPAPMPSLAPVMMAQGRAFALLLLISAVGLSKRGRWKEGRKPATQQ